MLDLLILYGSETGNCEELAKRIGRQALGKSIAVRVKSCDEYDVSQLIDETLVLFVCSTTGVGEEPNNMKKFWKFIRRKDLPKDSLSSVRISVIGLGDSSYEKFNFIAKKLYKRLLELGAIGLCELVLGDDQDECGPNTTVDPWLHQFWDEVNRDLNVSNELNVFNQLNQENDDPFDSSYSVEWVEPNQIIINQPLESSVEYNKQNPYLASVLSNERVTSCLHFQDVRFVRLEIENNRSLDYGLGDICMVKPQNSQENVDLFISLLNLDKDKNFILCKSDNNWMSEYSYYNNLPKPCSILTLVRDYCDIQSIPKRSFFELFWRFSQSDLEKQKLKELSSAGFQEDLYEYCNRPKRNILEVLSDFPNTTPHIKFEYIFDLIPAINPRPFSIASSLKANPKQIDLLVAVVNYKTRLKKPRLGLCSNWLSNQTVGAKVAIYIRKGTFKLPSNASPVIMIGPGTGVAPFRAFIQERSLIDISNNYLFFGCRYHNSDFYLENDWKQFHDSGHLQYFVAFSRDNENKKVYVQHILYEQKKLVHDLICKQNAWIYVSGNAKQMPNQVKQSLIDILKESDELIDDEKAEHLVNILEIKSRLQFECWS